MAKATVTLNQRALMAELSASEPVLKRVMDEVVEEAFFKPAVEQMQKEFETNAVTREIAGGLESNNVSNTLEGDFVKDGKNISNPNLWGFIGFDAAQSSPAEVLAPIRVRLDPRHPEGPSFIYKGRDKGLIRYRYEFRAPNEKAIFGDTGLPWNSGVSWVRRIEQGISGIGQFLNVTDRPSSRSGGGIQIEAQLRSGRYKPTPYLSRIFNNFLRRAAGRKATGRAI